MVTPDRLRRILAKMLDERVSEPLRHSLVIKFISSTPTSFTCRGQEFRVDYLPGESNSGMFGGNSNWRGPVWMPVNILIIRAARILHTYYGDSFEVECPTGSGRMMNLYEVSEDRAALIGIFTRDENGRRAVYGGTQTFQNDPPWRDHILFYEYFHGDNGAEAGASHQTGWTGLVAKLIELYGWMDSEQLLKAGKRQAFAAREKNHETVAIASAHL